MVKKKEDQIISRCSDVSLAEPVNPSTFKKNNLGTFNSPHPLEMMTACQRGTGFVLSLYLDYIPLTRFSCQRQQ